MLNKTKNSVNTSDNNILHFNNAYSEYDLLSKYISRENIDKLKHTLWFERRKKWKIPFRYNDLRMIREAIQHHPDDWELFLYDTIKLSESRHWIDWIITKTYQHWHEKNHACLNTLRYKRNQYLTEEKQLSALVTLYRDNVSLSGKALITETEDKLSAHRLIISGLENDIAMQQKTVLFSLRDMYDAFRAKIYHNSPLVHDHFPAELQVIIDSLLSLKEQNNNELLHNWLYQKNICFYGDILSWR